MLLMLKAGGGIRAVLPVCHRSGPYHDWSCDLAPTPKKSIHSFRVIHSGGPRGQNASHRSVPFQNLSLTPPGVCKGYG